MQLVSAHLWVHDQDEALAFYTETLGFEVRDDVTLEEMGFRWLTVAPPGSDVTIVLMRIPGPPMIDEHTAEQIRELMGKGFAGSVFLSTEDLEADYKRLTSLGVDFTDEPNELPYGFDSGFRDPSGNSLRLTQFKPLTVER